jgi:hypothetical protein
VNDGKRRQVDAAVGEVGRVEGAPGGLDPGRGLPLGLGKAYGADSRTQTGAGALAGELHELSGGKRLEKRRGRQRGEDPGGLNMREHGHWKITRQTSSVKDWLETGDSNLLQSGFPDPEAP